jgi:transposase
VQRFGALTADLYALAAWRRQCQMDTVGMEATGISWSALFEGLEARGFEVKLVEAHPARHVPGRKTDVKDGQWRQALHPSG